MQIVGSHTNDDGRVITQLDDGTWINEYGESVADPNNPDLTVDLAHTDGEIGSWKSGGSDVYGTEAEAAVFQADYVDPHGTDYAVTGGGLSGSAYIGKDELSVGFTANVVEAKAEFGDWDSEQAGESRVSGGLSLGGGAAGHITAGTDHDGDGRLEYGAEVDMLFFSAGYVTEESAPGSISTLDDQAYAAAGEYYDAAAQGVGDAYDTVTGAVDQAYNTGGEYYDSAAQGASEAYDSAAQGASDAYDAVAEFVSGDE
jgi:hypothetical protein